MKSIPNIHRLHRSFTEIHALLFAEHSVLVTKVESKVLKTVRLRIFCVIHASVPYGQDHELLYFLFL